MRKLLFLLASIILSTSVLLADEVHVSNLTELIHAMKSDRVIIVDADIDFNDGLEKYHNFNAQRLPALDYYEAIEHPDKYKDRSFIYDNYDGAQLCLAGFHNLTIKTNPQNSGRRSLLRIRPRYAYVLCFIGCSDISIEGLVMGHTDEGYCQGGVLEFRSCKNVSVNSCDMYGCGIEGICFCDSEGLKVTNSQIRDCSYQIMTIRNSKDVTFDGCFFFRNRQFSLLDLSNSSNLTFRNCLITHNEGVLFNVQECQAVLFDHCNMMHSYETLGGTENIRFKDCSWSDEFGVKREQ